MTDEVKLDDPTKKDRSVEARNDRQTENLRREGDLKERDNQEHAAQLKQSNNKDSLSDMQLQALKSTDADQYKKLATNRFELVDGDATTEKYNHRTDLVNEHTTNPAHVRADSPEPQTPPTSSYTEGLKAVIEHAQNPIEAEQKKQKFDRLYSLRKEAESLAKGEQHPSENLRSTAYGAPKSTAQTNSVGPHDHGGTHKAIRQRVVNPGETLADIAREYLGDGATAAEVNQYTENIAKDNNIADSSNPQAGSLLTLRPFENAATSESTSPSTVFDNLNQLMDKHYADPQRFEDRSVAREISDEIGVKTNRENLLAIAKKHGLNIEGSVSLIEDRAILSDVTAEEIDATYKQLARLLETESKNEVTLVQREILAQQILAQTADPTCIDQGFHNTCNVTSVEARIYSQHPSSAARLVTDLALNGEYLAADGTARVQQKALPIQSKCTDVPLEDGIRSYASELFQVCAVNIHYTKEGRGVIYEQTNEKLDEQDTGERLHDPSNSETLRSPNLPDNSLVGIDNAITGRSEEGFVFCHKSYVAGTPDKLTTIDSESDLIEKLKATPASNYPLIFGIHTGNEPFWTDSGSGAAGGAGGDSGGGHFVTVREFKPGPPPLVVIDNQWGKALDHVTPLKNLSVRSLYFAMRPPGEEAIEMEKILTNERNHGHRNAWYDLDLQRIRADWNTATPKAIEKDVINVLAERLSKKSDADEWERAAGAKKLESVLNYLPQENVKNIRNEQLRIGMLTQKEFEQSLIDLAEREQKRAARVPDGSALLLGGDSSMAPDTFLKVIDDGT